jgi:hypothetical protein
MLMNVYTLNFIRDENKAPSKKQLALKLKTTSKTQRKKQKTLKRIKLKEEKGVKPKEQKEQKVLKEEKK